VERKQKAIHFFPNRKITINVRTDDFL